MHETELSSAMLYLRCVLDFPGIDVDRTLTSSVLKLWSALQRGGGGASGQCTVESVDYLAALAAFYYDTGAAWGDSSDEPAPDASTDDAGVGQPTLNPTTPQNWHKSVPEKHCSP